MAVFPTQPPRTLRQLRILVIRHGETQENVNGTLQGQMDTNLNSFGRLQAAKTANYLSNIRLDRIITSPLKRARHTAEAILSKQPKAYNLQLEQDDRIKERAFGVLEGRPRHSMPKDRESTDEIEKLPALHERVAGFWNELITVQAPANNQIRSAFAQKAQQPEEEEEQVIALVSHGALIRALIQEVLLEGQYIHVPSNVKFARYENCCITELIVPTILDHRTPSPSLDMPGAPLPMEEWSVKPQHVLKAEEKEGRAGTTNDQLVLQDLGHGEGVGLVVRWADDTHVQGLVNPEEALGGEQSKTVRVNVDELVGR